MGDAVDREDVVQGGAPEWRAGRPDHVGSCDAVVQSVPRFGSERSAIGSLAQIDPIDPMREGQRERDVLVGDLPRDFFRPAVVEMNQPETETNNPNAAANILVVVCLAAMFCVGVTITGVCLWRRKLRCEPARVSVHH